MDYIVLLLLVLLLMAVIRFMYKMVRKKALSSNNFVTDHSVEKFDLRRWRGGVRYPAGYYKSESDFYKSEKQLHYSK